MVEGFRPQSVFFLDSCNGTFTKGSSMYYVIVFSGFLTNPSPLLWLLSVQNVIKNCHFLKFERFHENKLILKISAVYLMWNLKICQDAPNQGQDDLVLWCCFWILKIHWVPSGDDEFSLAEPIYRREKIRDH